MAAERSSTFLDPCEIRFTQNSIGCKFRNGLTLEDTACQLVNKDISKHDIEMIKVVRHDDGKMYTLDNRRLAVFRLVKFVGKCTRIKVTVVPLDPVEWKRKYDGTSDHTRVDVRTVKKVIAATLAETTYPMDKIIAAAGGKLPAAMVHSIAAVARVQEILDGMDSGDEEDDSPPGRRPDRARQTGGRGHRRKKNAADMRRGRRSNGWLAFSNDLEPFAAGRSRYAYRCRVQGGCVQGFSEGSYLVLKALKPDYRRFELSPDDSAVMQKEASALAEEFNTTVCPTQNGEACAIHIRDAAVVWLQQDFRNSRGSVIIRGGENYLLEREIFGDFRKFNSNNGWGSQTGATIPNAFSHWTWAMHGKLVCDLQGYQGKPPGPKYLGGKYYYLLTDPAIMSPDGRYGGGTDLGMQGIENWFSCHQCNEVCVALGIDRMRPRGRRTLPVESSSSLRETDNSYGPRRPAKIAACAVMAMAFIAEEESDYESD